MTATLDRPATHGMTPDHARALVLLADGKTAQEAASETGVQLGRIAQLARLQRAYIHPTTGKARIMDDPDGPITLDPQVRTLADQFIPPAPEPAPAGDSPEAIAELLRDAALYQATDGKIQNALERLHGAADRLRDLVYAAAERAELTRREAEAAAQKAAEQERVAAAIAEQEQQLAALRERARQLKGSTGRTRRTGRPRSSRSKTAKIREWAKAEGYDVGKRGLIPVDVITAYEQAHPTS